MSKPLLAFWLACGPGTASGGGQVPKDKCLDQATQLPRSETDQRDRLEEACRVTVGRLRAGTGTLAEVWVRRVSGLINLGQGSTPNPRHSL